MPQIPAEDEISEGINSLNLEQIKLKLINEI